MDSTQAAGSCLQSGVFLWRNFFAIVHIFTCLHKFSLFRKPAIPDGFEEKLPFRYSGGRLYIGTTARCTLANRIHNQTGCANLRDAQSGKVHIHTCGMHIHIGCVFRMGRPTLGAFRSTPLGIVAASPARALLDHRQARFISDSMPGQGTARAPRESSLGRVGAHRMPWGGNHPSPGERLSKPRSGAVTGASLATSSSMRGRKPSRQHGSGGAEIPSGPTARA